MDDSSKSASGKLAKTGFSLAFMIPAVLSLAGMLFYFYHYLSSQQDQAVNRHYLRVLAEAASAFNTNIDQIDSVLRHGSGVALLNLESLKEVTAEDTKKKNCTTETSNYFSFEGNQVYLNRTNAESPCYSSTKTELLTELLPKPHKDFSQYLLVGKDNKVLASRGRLQALSIIDVEEFSKQIAVELNRDWLQLASDFGSKSAGHDKPMNSHLPGFSHYLDIQLNPGKYRLYLFPFTVNPVFQVAPETAETSDNHVYLIGVIPKTQLKSKDSRRWNMGLYLCSVIVLVFICVMSRLFMLSKHQPVDVVFYQITMYSSYLLFAALTSVFFAYTESTLENALKAQQSYQLTENASHQLQQKLEDVFTDLQPIADFYHSLESIQQQPQQSQEALLNKNLEAQGKNLSGWQSEAHCQNEVCLILGEGMTFTATNDDGFKDAIWLDAAKRRSSPISIAFAMDERGVQEPAQFYYREFNHNPKRLELAHRDYFKKIMQQRGWQQTGFKSSLGARPFYIQRLRNLTDGTLGTTIGLPLNSSGQFRVLAADIDIDSITGLSRVDPGAMADITLMVVDRLNGDVLFHYDDSRVLNENLFSAGRDTASVRHAIQTGMHSSDNHLRPIKGNYQGFPGWFVLHQSPIDQWVIVSFYPSESINNYLSNIFFVNLSHFLVVLLAAHFLLYLCARLDPNSRLKKYCCIPAGVERRRLMLFLSVLVFSQIAGYWIGFAIDRATASTYAAWLLPMATLLITLLWGLWHYYRIARSSGGSASQSFSGAQLLVLTFLLTGMLITLHLNATGYTPATALQWYYSSLANARINQEREELTATAYSRFPNSILRHQQDPLALINHPCPQLVSNDSHTAADTDADYADTDYTDTCDTPAKRSARSLQTIRPEDAMYFSQLTQLTDDSGWMQIYLLKATREASKISLQTQPRQVPLSGYLAVVPFTALVLIYGWVFFNRKILYTRLFGTQNMLRFINQLWYQSRQHNAYQPDTRLLICEPTVYTWGVDLGIMLERARNGASDNPAFDRLLQHSGLLKTLNTGSCPPLKIHAALENDKLQVSLLGMASNLNRPECRTGLLQLIAHFKSLQQCGAIDQLTVFCNSGSLIMLVAANNMKDFRSVAPNAMTTEEYSEWAEVLREFSVRVRADDHSELDRGFIAREINALPTLGFIAAQMDLVVEVEALANQPPEEQHYRWANLIDRRKSTGEWHSIRFILLQAGAYYRSIWSACSAPEKLALLYLARGTRVNPGNTRVLENLATRGLVHVYRGRIRIVNQSFACFVQHAEDADTLQSLIQHGDLGAWNDYKLPVTILAATLFVALGLWSGDTLYVMLSSVLGALGLITNLIGSVGFIHKNMGG